jgi:hypothetical protein
MSFIHIKFAGGHFSPGTVLTDEEITVRVVETPVSHTDVAQVHMDTDTIPCSGVTGTAERRQTSHEVDLLFFLLGDIERVPSQLERKKTRLSPVDLTLSQTNLFLKQSIL